MLMLGVYTLKPYRNNDGLFCYKLKKIEMELYQGLGIEREVLQYCLLNSV